MNESGAVAQESRTEKVAIAVTKSEKDAIDIYLKVHDHEAGASGLLRDKAFAEVVAEGERILERLRAGEAA